MEEEDDESMLVPLRFLFPGYGGDASHRRQLALPPITAPSRFQLPDDWIVEECPRPNGAYRSRVDKYYYEPGSGHKFRSLREVERYLSGEVFTPRHKDYGTRKMIVSGGKMLRLDEERANQLQLAFTSPNRVAATSDFELPGDWTVEVIPRKDKKWRDKYYYEPGTGRKFRSLVSVERYLSAKRYLAEFDDDAPLSEAFNLGNHLKKKNISREKVRTNSVDPPVKVNWVFAGPGGDTWTPFIGESMVSDSVKQQWTEKFLSSMNDGNDNVPDSG